MGRACLGSVSAPSVGESRDSTGTGCLEPLLQLDSGHTLHRQATEMRRKGELSVLDAWAPARRLHL